MNLSSRSPQQPTGKTKTQIKSLPLTLRRNGHTLRQVERTEVAAIYVQETPGHSPTYELVRVRIRPPTLFRGEMLPERERYPGDELWGRDGWSYSECGGRLKPDQVLQQARRKMAQILGETTDPPQNSAAPDVPPRHTTKLHDNFETDNVAQTGRYVKLRLPDWIALSRRYLDGNQAAGLRAVEEIKRFRQRHWPRP